MTEEKKCKNPFIAAAQEAKRKREEQEQHIPHDHKQHEHHAKFHNQVNSNKPARRSAGRGR